MLRHLAACLALVALAAPTRAERPNIVVILSDDMGYSDLGCYGGEIATPNLDRLAAGGLRFTQFYNCARCCPTRASLLTGLYPHQAGMGHMTADKGKPAYSGNLNTSCRTIAEVLRPAGYGTYAVGKWHVTRFAKPDGDIGAWPLQRGFDRYYGTIHGAGSYYDPATLMRDNKQVSAFADPDYQPGKYYYTDAIGDHAVKFIADHDRGKKDQPLFMYVAFTAAHWPMHALPEDIARYKGKYSDGYEPIRRARFEHSAKLGVIDPRQGMAPLTNDWSAMKFKPWESACMECYAAMVDRMDQNVGKIVAELHQTGRLDNTLVFFLQDNGGCAELQGRTGNEKHPDIKRPDKPTLPVMKPEAFINPASVPDQTRDGYPVRMGKNAMPGPEDTYVAYGKGWATVSNTPFREYKHWVHEGGISTPLIAHWPARIKAAGTLRKQPGHLIDIMATCIDVAQAKYPSEATPTEGRSLVPAFANEPIAREAIYWEHEGNRAVRVGDYKAVAKGPGAAWELYDLAKDRVEANNIAQREPAKLKELVRLWEAYAKRTQVLPWVWEPAYEFIE